MNLTWEQTHSQDVEQYGLSVMRVTVFQITGLAIIQMVAFVVLASEFAPALVGFAVILAYPLIWLSVVDFNRYEIPDLAIVILVVGGIMYQNLNDLDQVLWSALAGGVTFVIMFGISVFSRFLLKKTALGFGDVKLLGASAIWVELIGVSSVIFLASASGILFIGIRAILLNGSIKAPVPFGPFIALGIWVVWLVGPIM